MAPARAERSEPRGQHRSWNRGEVFDRGDLEDRLEHGLTDLARQAPVPDDWPDLGTSVTSLDRRSTSRPRLVTGLVAVAAVIVIATAAFVVNRDPGASPTRSASAHD